MNAPLTHPTTSLGDLAEILSGFAFKSDKFSDAGDLPVIRIRDVKRGYSKTFYSGDYDNRYLVSDGDLLIGMDGEFNRERWRGGSALLNQRVCKLSPNPKKLCKDYLYHFLPKALKAIEDRTPFATVKHLSSKDIREVQIPLPPLNEQRRIAAILDEADALRHKRKRALKLIDKLTQEIFWEMFGARDDTTRELKDVVRKGTIVTYGIVQAGPEYRGGIPYIRTGDLVNGAIRLDGLRHTDPSIAARFARSRVEAGDIVMSIRATVGTTAIVPHELEGANLTQGTARISPGKDVLLDYLIEYIRSDAVQSWIAAQVKGATFLEITLGRLRELPVRVPPIRLQEQFSKLIAKVRTTQLSAIRHMAEADSLFSSLQSRAFTGQL